MTPHPPQNKSAPQVRQQGERTPYRENQHSRPAGPVATPSTNFPQRPPAERGLCLSSTARILEHRALTGSGCATDVIDIEMPSGMILHGCLVFTKDGRRWVSPPSKIRVWGGEVKTALDGKPIHDPVVTFASRDKADAFSALALAALDEYLAGGGHNG